MVDVFTMQRSIYIYWLFMYSNGKHKCTLGFYSESIILIKVNAPAKLVNDIASVILLIIN